MSLIQNFKKLKIKKINHVFGTKSKKIKNLKKKHHVFDTKSTNLSLNFKKSDNLPYLGFVVNGF